MTRRHLSAPRPTRERGLVARRGRAPKLELKSYELHTLASFRCRAPGCRRRAVEAGDGFELPFCRTCLALLTRALFEALSDAARASPFHPAGVARAEAVVRWAIARIRRRHA